MTALYTPDPNQKEPVNQKQGLLQPLKNLFISVYKRKIIKNYRALDAKPKFLLINATGRSGTSMMTYVLCSNPTISGFGESHTIYNRMTDFENHLAEVYWQQRSQRVQEKYVLDKVVYNRNLPDMDLLSSLDVKWVFILRHPLDTIASMKKYVQCTEAVAVEHYLERLERLQQDAQFTNPADSIFITYESVTAATEDTFQALSKFLELEQPLQQEYELPKAADDWRYSDQSSNLHSRKVTHKTNSYDLKLEAHHEQLVWGEYNRTVEVFQQYCTVPDIVKKHFIS